ncbi:helix-turn-helix transcriptional regulator [Vacuolonema iberomarrocanum]|uniref:helix-turn-helix transcriptional regulator n=1 Tax=Vacuolonema iberomarrocanum TaxID=3454632 RepID=UPI0019E28A55|nr:helix-turn-helix transcriptional regulator [filamentous cyanobacterium LEGE 07170]
MVSVLTGAEVDEILRECRVQGQVSDYVEGSEQFFELPSPLGRGYWRSIQLHPGLQLVLLDVEKHQIHRHRIQQHPQPMPLTFSYYLSGGCQVENDGLKLTHEETAGKSYLYCLPATAEVEHYPAEQRIRSVRFTVSREWMQIVSDRIHELPTAIRNAIEHPEKALLYCPGHITSAQQKILKQLFQCHYQGITRQLYLEAKVLELLALHFDQILTAPCSASQKLPASDVDRIYHAREILIQNMSQPPSLQELAKHVQLNERKLKQGFRQVLGTTVFGYLCQYRMEQAQKLLLEGGMSVQETAQYVGYASRSSFVAAFKKRFNVVPSSYLKK